MFIPEETHREAAAGVLAEGNGRARAARDVILLLVAPRFGTAPQAFRQRLEAIDDLDRLHAIVERTLEAESLEDLDLGT